MKDENLNSSIVIDASTALKLHFPKEEFASEVQKLFQECTNNKISLIAPTILLYEMTNAVRFGVVREKLTQAQSLPIVERIFEIDIQMIDFRPLLKPTYTLTTEHNLTVYDASYIALAQEKQCNFITADRRLYRKVKDKLSFITWIGNVEI